MDTDRLTSARNVVKMDASAADGLGAGCSAAWGRSDAGIRTAKVLPSPLNDDMFLDLFSDLSYSFFGC